MNYMDYLYEFEDESFYDYPGLDFDEEFEDETSYFDREAEDILEKLVKKDPCLDRCWADFNRCLRHTRFYPECLARLESCKRLCGIRRRPKQPPSSPRYQPPRRPYPPQPQLRFGSRGQAVRRLQRRLNIWIRRRRRSPFIRPLIVDGIFGPKTDAAVRIFQRSRGLRVDGIVGPRTWAKLKAL